MSLKGKTVVFSGVLSITRGKARDLALKAGATVANTVNNQTDILISPISNDMDSKVSQAQTLGITIWNEDSFITAVSNGGVTTQSCSKPYSNKEQRLLEHLANCLKTQYENNDGIEVPIHYFNKKSTDLQKIQIQFKNIVEKYHAMLAEERLSRSSVAAKHSPNRKAKTNKRDTKALKMEVQTRLKDADSFYRACVGGRLVLVRAFLQNGGDVNVELHREDGSRSFGLMEAIRHGHLEVAAKILASGANTSVRVGNDNDSPLHLAVRGRDSKMVQLLLRVECDTNVTTTKTGRTPLTMLTAHCVCGVYENKAENTEESEHWKLARTQARMAELLLSEGKADVDRKDGKGRTSICYAIERQNGPIIDVLNLYRKESVFSDEVCRFCRQCCGSQG